MIEHIYDMVIRAKDKWISSHVNQPLPHSTFTGGFLYIITVQSRNMIA